MIRNATADDIPVLVALGPDYLREAKTGGTYSAEATERSLRMMLSNPSYRILVDDEKGALAGTAIIALDNAWTVENWVYVQSFYVAPWARGMGVGRRLMKAISDLADEVGAVATIALSSGLSDTLFGNLAAKFGFDPVGRLFMRLRNA